MSEIPNDFQCPITMDLMEEPVICEDGYTYERKAILEYLKQNTVSPITRQPINKNKLIVNRNLKDAIERYKIDYSINIPNTKISRFILV